MKAVVLLSGGLDSATVLAMARQSGFDAYALTFRYGQRHDHEVAAAKRLAAGMGAARHIVTEIDMRPIGGSALTSELPVPKGRNVDTLASEVPVTYVPARNTIFLSYALALAETLNAWDIFIGVNAVDYSGYPDCRPEYIEAFEQMARLATKAGIEGRGTMRIHTPLMHLSKAEIIRAGLALGVEYGITSTCYDPDAMGAACGLCDACLLRRRGFEHAGVADPTRYALTR